VKIRTGKYVSAQAEVKYSSGRLGRVKERLSL